MLDLDEISQQLQRVERCHITPSSALSGTFMSSKTPGRDLDDRWSLDSVSEVGS